MPRRTAKWLLILTGAAATLVLAWFGGKTLAKREVEKAIREELRKSFRMKFDSIEVSIFPGNCRLTGVEMEPPVSQFLGKKASVSAGAIIFENIGWAKLLWFNELSANRMEVDDPVVILQETPATWTIPPKKESTKSGLGVIQFDQVVFRNANFRILKNPEDSLLHSRADTLSFDLRGLRIRLKKHESLRLNSGNFFLANLETAGSDSFAVPAFSAEKFKINLQNLRMSLVGDLPVNVRDVHFSFKNFEAKSAGSVIAQNWSAANFETNLHTVRLTLKNNKLLDVRSGDFYLQDFLLKGNSRLGEPTYSAADLRLGLKAFYLGIEKMSPLSVGDTWFTLKNVRLPGSDPYHHWHVNSIAASKQDGTLKLTGFALRLRYSKRVFPKKTPKKVTRKDFEFPEIVMRSVSFERLFKGDLVAGHVTVSQPGFDAFQDRNLPHDYSEHKKLPQELLRNAKLTLHFDTVALRDGKVHFEEIAPGKWTPGVIDFASVQATALNVSNDPASIRRKPVMTVSAKGKFQDQAWVSSRFEVDLSSPDYAFTCRGSAEPMPFTLFNSILAPSTNYLFEGGELKKMAYSFSANNYSATGEMNLQYQGLDIAVRDEAQQKKVILSELAELVMFIKKNKPGDDDFRLGKISVKRERSKSFFNLWWQAVMSGLTSTVLSNAGVKQMQRQKEKQKSN